MNKNLFPTIWLAGLLCILALPQRSLASAAIPNHSFEKFDETTWQCDEKCTAGNAFDYQVSTSDLTHQPSDGIRYLYIFHEAGLYQNVSLPSDARSLTFGYYNTEDDTGDAVYDGVFTITLTDVDSGEVYAQETFSDQADNWGEALINLPASAQGKTAQLYITNVSGISRIDNFVFSDKTVSDLYPTVRLTVFSAKLKAIKGAKIFIKSGGEKIDLIYLTSNEVVKSVATNKKGRTPKFIITKQLAKDETVKLCVKKGAVQECLDVAPAAGVETNYDFAFENKKVSRRRTTSSSN